MFQGQFEEANEFAEQALKISQQLYNVDGCSEELARSLHMVGVTLRNLKQIEQSAAHLEQSLQMYR